MVVVALASGCPGKEAVRMSPELLQLRRFNFYPKVLKQIFEDTVGSQEGHLHFNYFLRVSLGLHHRGDPTTFLGMMFVLQVPLEA